MSGHFLPIASPLPCSLGCRSQIAAHCCSLLLRCAGCWRGRAALSTRASQAIAGAAPCTGNLHWPRWLGAIIRNGDQELLAQGAALEVVQALAQAAAAERAEPGALSNPLLSGSNALETAAVALEETLKRVPQLEQVRRAVLGNPSCTCALSPLSAQPCMHIEVPR